MATTFAHVISTAAPSSPQLYARVLIGTVASPTTIVARSAMTAVVTVGATSAWELYVAAWDNSWANPRVLFDDGADLWYDTDTRVANVAQINGSAADLVATVVVSPGSSVEVGNYNVTDQSFRIRKGDSYGATSGQRITVTKPAGASWPSDLTGWTLTFTASKRSNNDQSGDATLTVTCAHGTETGSSQSFYIDLTAANTDSLATGLYDYDVQASSGVLRNTLVGGLMRVMPEYSTT